jgi:hypothetical protein
MPVPVPAVLLKLANHNHNLDGDCCDHGTPDVRSGRTSTRVVLLDQAFYLRNEHVERQGKE